MKSVWIQTPGRVNRGTRKTRSAPTLLRRTPPPLLPLLLPLLLPFTAGLESKAWCDPQTQYELDGHCCRLCPPGTSMSSQGTCTDPHCKPCPDGEYQDAYSDEAQCKRQPYCDPNTNFLLPVQESKTQRSVCLCKPGFHCSANICLTCVPHTVCTQGWGAKVIGNHSRDTQCEECADGTFSNQSSFDGVCMKWTQCAFGYRLVKSGSATSDNVCKEATRQHVYPLVICLVLFVLGLLASLTLTILKGRKEKSKNLKQVCVEVCLCKDEEPKFQTIRPVLEETDAPSRTPEENEDDIEVSSAAALSENGNYVTQENGKSVVLSRQESQTQSLTD